MTGGNESGTEDQVDQLDEGEELDELDRVTLVSEEGEELQFVLLAVIEHEEQDYAMLAPEDQLMDDAGDELEIYLFSYDVDDEGLATFGPIEDDQTYEAVREFCSTLMDGGLAE